MIGRWIATLLLAASLTGAADAARAEMKVGITVSGSGPGAALGQPELKAVAVLPKEIAGEKVTYIALDDESDGTKAAQNARKLLDENVDVLIGSSLTPTSLPLIELAASSGTPLMTLAASGVLVSPMDAKKKWVFKVVPNDDIMARAMLARIAQSGVKKLGYIGVSDAYGEGYYAELAKLAPEHGITLTTHEVYGRGDASVTGQILKIIATRPDAVFIASAGTPAVLPQKALRDRGYKGPIYQTHGVATQEFIQLGGKDVEGATFAGEVFTVVKDLPDDSPFKKPIADFVGRYEAANGAPPAIFAAHLNDAMTLVERAVPAALKAGKPGTPAFRSALRDAIETTKAAYLSNGLSNMSPTDHNGYDERSAFIIKVENGQFRWVK